MKQEDNWIKKYMDDNEVSIAELADILNLSRRTVKGYYKRWQKPGKKIMLNIMKIFDIEPEEMEEQEI